jgi:dihydropyrimidinase
MVMMHAENSLANDVLVEQALARGETGPRHYGEARRAL